MDNRQVCQKALRSSIALVAQDIMLLKRSIRDDSRYGCIASKGCDIDDVIVWRALCHASTDSFVRWLPNGLDTIAGKRCAPLSGGERQRVGTARVIILNESIVVSGEEMSALYSLDERAENIFLGSCQKMKLL